MSDGGSVTVDVAGRDVNLVALLTRMEAQMKRTDQVGIRLAQTTGGTFTAAQQKAANAAIVEAQALARAAVAAGDDAAAHRILVGALGNSAAASDKSVASLTASINRLQSGGSAAQEFGSSLKSGLLNIVGPAALATAAIGGVVAVAGSFKDAFLLKASLDATTASINAQLSGMRDTSVVYAQAATFANTYKLTQQETTEAIAASIGVMRSSKAGVEDILGVLARLQVLSPEQSLQEAAVAVKALASGDTTSLVTRFEVGRDVASQMKAEIAGGADAVQVLNKFLNDTGIGMDALAAKATGASGKLKELAQAEERRQLAQAGQSGGAGLAIIQAQINVNNALANALSGNANALYAAAKAQDSAYNQALHRGATEAEAARAGTEAYQATLQRLTPITEQVATALTAATQAAAQASGPHVELGAAMDVERTAAANATSARIAGLAAMDAERQTAAQTSQAILDLRAATEGNTASLVDHIAQQQASQLAGQQLAQVQATLASLGSAVAGGLQTAGAAALALSQQYNIAYGSALQLIQAQAALAQAKVNAGALADQRAGERDGGSARTQAQITLEANGARLRAAAERKREQEAQQGRRSAGAVRLSDQQKLNNTLLADQERYQDQAAQAERQHQDRILDIQREAAERQLAQQKKNEIDKRESELGFLESITASELNATQEGRDAIAKINERYYADFEKAQAAAQAGNAAQSEAMVKAAGERAAAEQRYAEQIEQARQDGNESEIARLEALREKQRQILDEKEKQIAEGGDANVNQTNEALAAEQERFEEQQGKNATAAENASERKVNAALRSGKAVSDETKLLLEQEQVLQRMGRNGTGPGGASTPPPAATAPGEALPTTPAAPGAPADAGAALAAALESIASAVADAKAAIVRAQGETTSAVRGIQGRVLT